MKKVVVLLAISLAFLVNKTAAAAGDFVIMGTITGLPDSTLVYLTNPMQPGEMLATAYAQKGKFVLFGKVEEGSLYQLAFIGFTDMAELFLTPGKLTVNGDAKAMSKLAITGTQAQEDYRHYNKNFDPLKQKLGRLANTINQTPQGSKRDSMIMDFENSKMKVLQLVDAFVKEKPGSVVTPFVVFVTAPINNDPSALESRYNAMSAEVKGTYYGREINKSINAGKIGMEGTEAVDFTQNDTADRPVTLSSFRGKYVLIDFWASWCKPCRMENPNVVAAYNTYKNKNFTVLGVSLDQTKEKWLNAIKEDGLAWTQVSDLKSWQNEVAGLYHIQSIPANMLIDPSGKIIGKNLRGEALNETLGKLLK